MPSYPFKVNYCGLGAVFDSRNPASGNLFDRFLISLSYLFTKKPQTEEMCRSVKLAGVRSKVPNEKKHNLGVNSIYSLKCILTWGGRGRAFLR